MNQKSSIFVLLDFTLKFNNYIGTIFGLLLIVATLNACIPWNTLVRNAAFIEMESEEDQKNETQDDRDAEDDKEERDERIQLSMGGGYLGIQSILHLISFEGNAWNLHAFLHQDHPVIDILIPPPKLAC